MHQRVAKDFRAGRVLIAGDAAHLNNPMGGFGLNSGIHDAINLADKLGKVWRGEADGALLDLYVGQRRAATIEQVQAMSIRNKRLLEERDPAVQRKQLLDLIAIAADADRARKYLLEVVDDRGTRAGERSGLARMETRSAAIRDLHPRIERTRCAGVVARAARDGGLLI